MHLIECLRIEKFFYDEQEIKIKSMKFLLAIFRDIALLKAERIPVVSYTYSHSTCLLAARYCSYCRIKSLIDPLAVKSSKRFGERL